MCFIKYNTHLNEMRMPYLIDIVQGLPAKNSEQSRENFVKFMKSKMKLPDKSFLSMTCDSAGVYFKACKLLKEMDGSPFTLVGGCLPPDLYLQCLTTNCEHNCTR